MTPAAYDLADQLFALAPWDWMNESMLIALEHPESGRRDHISLMGMAGNHFSLAVYTGPESRRRFNLIQECEFEDIPLQEEDMLSLILDTPQLQCSFSERSDLFKSELAAIKAAGKKYRGECWPSFRSFRPGRCPIPADETEVAWLCTAIQQVLEVAPTLRLGDDTLRFDKSPPEILTRSFRDGVWESSWTADDSSLQEFSRPRPDDFLIEKVRRHTRLLPLEVQFQIIPSPVGKSRETSVYPYLLLAVEPGSRLVLGCEMLSVENSAHDELIRSVPTVLLRLCDRSSIRPASIAVTSPVTQALLAETADALGIPCHLKSRLPALEHALHSMMDFMK